MAPTPPASPQPSSHHASQRPAPLPTSRPATRPNPQGHLPAPLAVRDVGERALLLDLPDTAAVLAVADALRLLAPPGLLDLVPAESTLLLEVSTGEDRRVLRRLVGRLPRVRPEAPSRRAGELVLDVRYDGRDLAEVAELLGRSPEAVVAAHTGTVWVAAFGGFAPGFAYLLPEGPSPLPEVPRRPTSRPRVPAGSVALAARYSAVYPGPSPGGWQLIGETDAPLWNPHRAEPALLTPGDRVRFRAVRSRSRTRATGAPRAMRPSRTSRAVSGHPSPSRAVLTVVDPGPLTLVEDGGRPSRASLGVTGAGAFDRTALVRANTAVGNRPRAAALEVLIGPLVLRADAPVVLACAGAPAEVSIERVDTALGRVHPDGAFALDAGDVVRIGPVRAGLRCVLALRGGVVVAGEALGSLSRDTLAGLGPDPLRAGDAIAAGPARGLSAVALSSEVPDDERGAPRPAPSTDDGTPDVQEVPWTPGPRADLLGEAAVSALEHAPWTVRPDSDRVGVRLDGTPLPMPDGAGILPSEAVVAGAVQVPPSGLPVVFGPDHPTTGGYPVIGVVTAAGLDLMAQAAPGTSIRFVRDHDPDIGTEADTGTDADADPSADAGAAPTR